MSEFFYTITDLVFKFYNDPIPVPTPTPTPYTPFDWLSFMALTQTGDFIGFIAILLAAVATVSGLFVFAKSRSKGTKALSIGAIAVILAGVCAFAGTVAANATNADISKGEYTADRIEVLSNIDGSGGKFGDSPYGSKQVFTNTTKDKAIEISGVGIEPYDEDKVDIGTWTCYSETLQEQVFSGTAGSQVGFSKNITLNPGETATFIWNSDVDTLTAYLLSGTTPAAIGYECSYKDMPTDSHALSVNPNGGTLSAKATTEVGKDGWVATVSVETGEITYHKTIYGNDTTPAAAFQIWDKLLKTGEITSPAGSSYMTTIEPMATYITENTTYTITWSKIPVLMITGKVVSASGARTSLEGTTVTVMSKDLEVLYQTTVDENNLYNVPSYLVDDDDVYIKTILRNVSSTTALTGSDYTWTKGSTLIEDITMGPSTLISGVAADTSTGNTIANANINIYVVSMAPATGENGILDAYPVYHNKTAFDGSYSCYVRTAYTQDAQNGRHYNQVFVQGSKEGYNTVMVQGIGVLENNDNAKVNSVVPLTKLDNCFALCGTIKDGDSQPVSGYGVIFQPETMTGNARNALYLAETDSDGQYCMYVPAKATGVIRAGAALEAEKEYYYKYFNAEVTAKDSYVNDITGVNHKLSVKLSDGQLPDFSPSSTAWTKTPSVAYTEYTNTFIEGSSVEYVVMSLGMPEVDSYGQTPLHYTFSSKELLSDASGELIWTKGRVEMISLDNREIVTLTDQGRKSLEAIGMFYIPSQKCFSMKVDSKMSPRQICEALLDVSKKYQAEMGELYVKSAYGYDFISFYDIDKIESGIDGVFIQWDDGDSAEVNINLEPAWITNEGMEFLAENGWEHTYNVNIHKYFKLGTPLSEVFAEIEQLRAKYKATTGEDLIVVYGKEDEFVGWDESPSPLAVYNQQIYAYVDVQCTPQVTGNGELKCNGETFKAPFNIRLSYAMNLQKEVSDNTVTVYLYKDGNPIKTYKFTGDAAQGGRTDAITIVPPLSSWTSSFSIFGTFIEDKAEDKAIPEEQANIEEQNDDVAEEAVAAEGAEAAEPETAVDAAADGVAQFDDEEGFNFGKVILSLFSFFFVM